MSNNEASEKIEIPQEMIDRIETRVSYTEFGSVSAYIEHVLEEVLYQVESNTDVSDSEQIDDSDVEDRLKSLGYLKE